MILYLIALTALCLFGLKFSGFREDYLGKNQTDSLKGIFALLIVFSHVRAHIEIAGTGDALYSAVFTRMGQMTVVPFLFYSGYGILQGIGRKRDYEKHFFKNRILKFLIGYNIVTLVLGILYAILGFRYPVENYLLAWCGWTTVGGTSGNGMWFVFVLLVLYVVTYMAFLVFQKLKNRQKLYRWAIVAMVFVSSLIFMGILVAIGKEDYWYNTLMAYSLGMLYGILREKIDLLMRKFWIWAVALCAVCVGAGLILISGFKDAISYSVMGGLFILFVTLITMRVRIENRVLIWLGGLSFGIYILQRSFMILFQTAGINTCPVLFTALVIAATLAAAVLHRWISGKLNKLLPGGKKK